MYAIRSYYGEDFRHLVGMMGPDEGPQWFEQGGPGLDHQLYLTGLLDPVVPYIDGFHLGKQVDAGG